MSASSYSLAALAVALAVGGVQAQSAAPPASAPATTKADAVDPASIQALKDMGSYLLTLKRFQVTTELTGERVLMDGQKLQHTATAVLDVERPNKLRAVMRSARSERSLYYDGKTAVLYAPAQKAYSKVEMAVTVGELVEKLENRFGIEVPLADLFEWGTPNAPTDKIESAMNAGQDIIDGTLTDHFAFRQGKFDWQIWIAAGGKPLPRKLVITNRADEARPQSVSTIDWNLSPGFKNSVFTFTPPKGSVEAKIVPLKTK